MISVILLAFIGLMILGIISGGIGGILLTVGILVAVVLVGVGFSILQERYDEKLKKEKPELWKKKQQEKEIAKKRAEEKEKQRLAKLYNNYQYTCPMCGSHKVRNLSFDEKTKPTKVIGMQGKNYRCADCKYIW